MARTPIRLLGPSILNADLSSLSDICGSLLEQGADYLHLDVMDGHFVPNLTFGHTVVKCLRPKLPTETALDLHMMVSNPENWIVPMHDAGATWYTFHQEATDDVLACIRKVHETGMKCGLAIKPATSVEAIIPFADEVDMFLVMTVEPGFGGQRFMENMMNKVVELRGRFPEMDIEVDGGVSTANVQKCLEAGANMIVSGSAITGSSNPRTVISDFKRLFSIV